MKRLTILAALGIAGFAQAGVIVEDTAGLAPGGSSAVFGESFTTPSGGPWDDLAFNFFSNVPPTAPLAAGTAFLLSEAYSGTPSALSSSTPGFLAESTGITGGQWIFAPGVTVLPDTTYWIYANASAGPSGGDTSTSFVAYVAASLTSDFTALGGETGVANFALDGAVSGVPEPATTFLILAGLAALAGIRLLPGRLRTAPGYGPTSKANSTFPAKPPFRA